MKFIKNIVIKIYKKIITLPFYKSLSKKLGKWLDNENRNSIKFDISFISIFSTVILTILGFLYLLCFFGEFKIPYERYFNIIDCVNILYIKSTLYYYTISFLALISIPLFLLFISQVKIDNKRKKNLYIFFHILISFAIYFYTLYKADDDWSFIKIFNIFIYTILIFILWFINYKYIAIAMISFMFTG